MSFRRIYEKNGQKEKPRQGFVSGIAMLLENRIQNDRLTSRRERYEGVRPEKRYERMSPDGKVRREAHGPTDGRTSSRVPSHGQEAPQWYALRMRNDRHPAIRKSDPSPIAHPYDRLFGHARANNPIRTIQTASDHFPEPSDLSASEPCRPDTR